MWLIPGGEQLEQTGFANHATNKLLLITRHFSFQLFSFTQPVICNFFFSFWHIFDQYQSRKSDFFPSVKWKMRNFYPSLELQVSQVDALSNSKSLVTHISHAVLQTNYRNSNLWWLTCNGAGIGQQRTSFLPKSKKKY